uniref:Uncharacterized protein n=1 Tax=Panagrolaimus davidi TaxID=227884 RepID=A0A914QLZ9_9BILA
MLISILWIILLIFQYLQYTYAQRLTSESPNFYDIPFFKSSDFVQIISTAYVNSSLIGTAPRIYGLKNEYQEIEFEICAPTPTECEKQKGRLALCYFHPNAEDDMENDCHRNFCSIDFKFNGTDSSNRNITISTKYERK